MTTSDPQGVTPEDLTRESAGREPAGADQGVGGAGGDAGTPPRGGSPKHTYYEGGAGASAEPGGDDEYDHASNQAPGQAPGPAPDQAPGAEEAASDGPEAALAEEDTMAATLLADLQRLQAEYVNYKKRVDRDRDVIRHAAVGGVVESLLPVLDDIHSAREAGALEDGPFAAIAEKLESILGRFGVERLGEKGEEFDPTVHEALMHVEAELPEEATGTTVVQVIQPGYRIGERLVRAARVSVADPA